MATAGSPYRDTASRSADRKVETTAWMATAGSFIEGLCGIAAIVLAILIFADRASLSHLDTTIIIVGAGLILEGLAVASLAGRDHAGMHTYTRLGAGMTAELIGGSAAVVLGILALMNVRPNVLEPVALIAMGGAILIGSTATIRIAQFRMGYRMENGLEGPARETTAASSAGESMVGLASIVLGILALMNIAPNTLMLSGLLALGCAQVMSGLSITGQMAPQAIDASSDRNRSTT